MNFENALKECAFSASCAENSTKKIKRNKVIKQDQEPTQVQDFPSDQKELYRHRLHHQMAKNIWNQLNNTKEELKKINKQTKININQMQEVPQEILNIKSYQLGGGRNVDK